MLRSVFRV